ncbi:hypothetical protein KPL71_026853 [Citrus sinensis]|uniref:Uncharacterized protein n=1 Tax=Citrus sinensis TaxID=2711 RepID=A0ACB8I225_CITSI|nr:hypothetical protein KPL71_026853 [Citrus sinensis]
MHIEKNICDSIIGMLLNMKGKSKDGLNSRLDLIHLDIRKDLHPKKEENFYCLPAASHTLSKEEKELFCKRLADIKLPDGYGSNITNCISVKEHKITGLKSNHCHILIQQLLPVALRGILPEGPRKAILRLRAFFKELCSRVLDRNILEKLEEEVVETLCMLERFFPPSFFDIMVHLTIHLGREARLCGPVQYCWMYMKILKGYVRNRARPKGCIAERYLAEEYAMFCGTEHLEELKGSDKRFENNEKLLQNKHVETFNVWLHEKIKVMENHINVSNILKWLSRGPRVQSMSYSGFVINGLRFHTKDAEKSRQNNGVSLEATTICRASAKDNAQSSKKAEKRAKKQQQALFVAATREENVRLTINSHENVETSTPSTNNGKRKRGLTTLAVIRDHTPLLVECNERGQPVRVNSEKYATFAGVAAREHVPIVIKDWRLVPSKTKEDLWSLIKHLALRNLGDRWRQYKSEITTKIKEANKKTNRSRALALIRPKNVIFDEDWEAFVKHRLSPEFEASCGRTTLHLLAIIFLVLSDCSFISLILSTRFDLEKFNGENDFYLWNLKMRAILIQQGLDSALDDEEESKSKRKKEEGSSSLGGDSRTINNKAHSTIILHLSDEVLREVAKKRTASGLWAKLEELFLKKSLAKRLYMKRKLYTFSMKEGTAMKDHLDEFNKLILDLENVNVMLEDEDRALILLSSLPDSYEHYVDTLLNGRQTLTLKDVKNALESKDLKKRSDFKDQTTGDGLVVKAKSEKKVYKDKKNKNQKEKDDKKKKKRKCYFCQREGHYIKDCFEKKKLEKLQKETNGKAAVAFEDEEDAEGADVLIAAERQPTAEWILDSGCSFHMCPNKEFFKTFESINGGKVLLGNNLACKVTRMGTINIQMFDEETRELKQVRYVPKLKRNLISLGMMDKMGCSIKTENGKIEILNKGEVIMKGVRRNGLYVLVGSVPQLGENTNITSDKTKLWHMRLGHMSQKGIKELEKQGLFGHDQISQLEFCEKCVFGKATRLKFNTGKHETKQTLDYIHSDIWGPSQVPSHGGARYFITFIDDFSRKLWVYILKHKSEALDKFKEWIALMENQIGRKIKRLRTDNGLEYCSNEFDEFCKRLGIARQKTVRYTPQQNGLAERMNKTLIEKVRYMLLSSNLSKYFWAEAVVTAAYLINRSPSSALEFKTPQEVWSGKPPDLSNLKVFGCPAYAHIKQGKLEPRAVKGYFIGYPEGIKGYKIWSINGKPTRIFISRDVVFDEEALTQSRVETEITNTSSEENGVVELEVESPKEAKQHPKQTHYELKGYQLARDRIRRTIKMPERYGVADLISYALAVAETETSDEPATYKQAMRTKDKRKWLAAMEEEMASLRKNKTWTLTGYVDKILSRFGMKESKPVLTPLGAQFRLSKQEEPEENAEVEHMKNMPYSSVVGCIMYAMVCTRPDLAYGIGVLSRFMSNPGKHHWNAAKWMLRYLKGTAGHGIVYGRVDKSSDQVQGYVDSDFAGDLDKKRSITGYVYTLCGGAVSWKASLQSVVALSTTEAEYIALSEAVKEAIWLKGLVTELGLEDEIAQEVVVDDSVTEEALTE